MGIPKREGAERIDNAEQMTLLVRYEYGVDFVLMQDAFDFRDFRVGRHHLGLARHDVGNGEFKETVLRGLHGAAYVAVGDDAAHDAFLFCHAEAEAAVAHVDHSLAKLHCGRDYGQVFRAHHVACLRQEAFAE